MKILGKYFFHTVAALALLFVMVSFQNCAGKNFVSTADDTLGSGAGFGGVEGNVLVSENFDSVIGNPADPGLLGGHFDLDTATSFYEFNQGQTNKHVHEYDDKYNLNFADYFALQGAGFNNIQSSFPANIPFVLIIGNAQLSPGAVVEINGTKISVVEYQNRVRSYQAGNSSALKVYSLDGQAGTERLVSLKIILDLNAILNNRLIPTQTDCVVSNNPGKNGEYRNGALVIQALDVRSVSLNTSTGVAASNTGFLWESTIFYHKDGGTCF